MSSGSNGGGDTEEIQGGVERESAAQAPAYRKAGFGATFVAQQKVVR